jgi:pyruvate,water dikinase
MSDKLIAWFEDLGRDAVNLAGGKGANLGEMIRAGIPVPSGFSILIAAYERFMAETGAASDILPYLAKLPEEREQEYEEISKAIRGVIQQKDMPGDIKDTISQSYEKLSQHYGKTDLPVAVRSSGVAEDAATASFAGQFETYLNVKRKTELLGSVKKCWASLFTAQAISYRMGRGLPADGGGISVCVQKMVNARSAGICFTVDPVTGNPSKMVIEGNWGMGESVVQGILTPDRYIVNKDTLDLERASISEKRVWIISVEGGTRQEEVPLDKRNEPCLTNEEVRRIAERAKAVETHYAAPQDIEWVVDHDLPPFENLFFVQTRPVTVTPEWKSATNKVIDSMLNLTKRISER